MNIYPFLISWPRYICDCDKTPTTSFKPDWVSDCGTKTKDFERYILKSLVNATVSDVALKLKLSEEEVNGVMYRNVHITHDWKDRSITCIGLDEVAIKKGHNYYTIVYDLSNESNKQVLFVIDGREKDVVVKELQTIPHSSLNNLRSVCSDMSSSYIPAIKDWLSSLGKPWEDILTIDRFHVAKLLGEKADNIRKNGHTI